ncbi:hypothetical protein [Psychromonas algicola]|uniref:hypothetical protein n=1 Tax=Psychromonas algicola TaxID=2555642 RepID=UPI001068CC31|nr:hypothetical protein [Psychromonas sp. RZ5]TEW48286.1 hypothetical protein E2R67_11770 [Psychromonas sp. RZ5]
MSHSYYITLLLQMIYLFCLAITVRTELNFLVMIFGVALLFSFIGLLYHKTKNKFFAYLGIASFIIYLPIGLFGIISIKNEMDKESKLKFLQGQEKKLSEVTELESDEITEIEQPKKAYLLKTQKYFIPIGIFCIAVGLIIAPATIAPGILLIVVASLNKRLEVLRVYEKHSEIKLAIAAPRRFIKHSSIKDVAIEKNIFILTFDENGKEKNIKISLKALIINDEDELLNYYKSFV